MVSDLIWLSGVLLELLLLVGGAKDRRLLKAYPLFYGHVGCVFLCQLLRRGCYWLAPGRYCEVYWYSQFVLILASYIVVFEIYRRTLATRPKLSTLANILLVLAFAASAGVVCATQVEGGFRSASEAFAALSRDLRAIEAVLLVILLGIFLRYRISAGRNLKGLVFGYAFLVGTDVTNLALLLNTNSTFSLIVRQVLPLTYLVTLAIWCFAFWSFAAEIVPQQDIESLAEYESYAVWTQATLSSFTKIMRRSIHP